LPRQVQDKHEKIEKRRFCRATTSRNGRRAHQPKIARGEEATARKRHFLRHLYIKIIILPRQARDKHRENSKKVPFSQGEVALDPRAMMAGEKTVF
jgi:hypothetical protein